MIGMLIAILIMVLFAVSIISSGVFIVSVLASSLSVWGKLLLIAAWVFIVKLAWSGRE
jgi:hypothetical protein